MEKGLAVCFVASCQVKWEGRFPNVPWSLYHLQCPQATPHLPQHLPQDPIFHPTLQEISYLQKELSSQVLKLLLSTARVTPRQTPKQASTKPAPDLQRKKTKREQSAQRSEKAPPSQGKAPSHHNPKGGEKYKESG